MELPRVDWEGKDGAKGSSAILGLLAAPFLGVMGLSLNYFGGELERIGSSLSLVTTRISEELPEYKKEVIPGKDCYICSLEKAGFYVEETNEGFTLGRR